MPISFQAQAVAICLAALSAAPLTSASPHQQVPISLTPQSHTQDYKFDPLLHLPGISPYFDAVGSGLSHSPPRNCKVTAASYLVRHAAIYANDADYEKYIEPILVKMNGTFSSSSKDRRHGWTGPLSFFDKWTSPITDPESQLEQITPQGIKDSRKVAKHLLSRYPSLIPTTKKIYADKKDRTQDTAKAFADVFSQKVQLVEIHAEDSFHSQIPHKSCDKFSKEPGDEELAAFLQHYTVSTIARLQRFSPVELTGEDVMGLQQMCGYESAINGKVSKICGIFTDDEWMAYEYAWDLKYSYMVGHGNPLSPYLGFPWLNTTARLMSKFHAPEHDDGVSVGMKKGGRDEDIPDDDGQRFFLAFTHREVPPFIATALGLFNSSNAHTEEFPTDRINWSRAWKMAELIPFLGHIGVEKLTCEGLHSEGDGTEEFIRIIANSSPRPIPACQEGPGASCGVDRFVELVRAGMEEFGDFDGICGNEHDHGL